MLTTNSGILVAAVFTVGVSVALPGIVYAPAVGFALEFKFTALERTFGFVALVAAIVGPVANRHARGTITVRALEHTRPTISRRATRRLVGAILAVLLSVASAAQFFAVIFLSLSPFKEKKKEKRKRSIIIYLTSSTKGYTSRREVRNDADPRCNSRYKSCRPCPG